MSTEAEFAISSNDLFPGVYIDTKPQIPDDLEIVLEPHEFDEDIVKDYNIINLKELVPNRR